MEWAFLTRVARRSVIFASGRQGASRDTGFLGRPAYRCSLIDAAKNVRSVEHLDSRDDAEVVIRAIAVLGEQTRYPLAEVWCGARIVACLPKPDACLAPPQAQPAEDSEANPPQRT
jgi:hypothetical protein